MVTVGREAIVKVEVEPWASCGVEIGIWLRLKSIGANGSGRVRTTV
jgi:hypothetical protein